MRHYTIATEKNNRNLHQSYGIFISLKKTRCKASGLFLVGEGGFEPPKQMQQIYSLSPLATRELSHIWF